MQHWIMPKSTEPNGNPLGHFVGIASTVSAEDAFPRDWDVSRDYDNAVLETYLDTIPYIIPEYFRKRRIFI